MTSSDEIEARIAALRQRSRHIASDFAAEMDRLSREVTQRAAFVIIEMNERDRVAAVAVDPATFAQSPASALAGASTAALALAGVSAMPDRSAEARAVMALLEQGVPAPVAIDEVVEEQAPQALERHDFPEMAIVIDRMGAFSVMVTPEWRSGVSSVEFAAALQANVNTVLDRRGERNSRGAK